MFTAVVLVPTLLATVYYLLVASDIYVSESRFVVRAPDKPAQTPLGSLLKGAGFSNAGDEIFAVRDFVGSRDALTQVNSDGLAVRAFTAPGASIFERYAPFGLWNNQETLYRFYQQQVSIEYDSTSSILRLTVATFDPNDATRMNQRLLNLSEALVNRLNYRGRTDLVKFSLEEVDEARARAISAGNRLAAYRNRARVVDPEKQAGVQLQMIGKLQDDLVATRNQLRQLEALTPQNPQIESTRVRVKGLEQEIAGATNRLTGGQSSLAGSTAQYQRLLLDSGIAEKQLAAAMASQAEANNETRRKQAYVERIVEPNLPDYPSRPKRFWGILSVFALSVVVWLVLRLLLAGVREHQD
ncbi:MAG: hypothetical protein B7Y98_11920 [Sphingomonas sp. 32-62-10]|nr:MAG: hypothetical protein B7Y98_11920 [Sphingomonas sp. 32-62-10]